MCGIFFSAIRNNGPHEDNAIEKTSIVKEACLCGLNETLLDRLSCRGPDSSHTISRKGPSLKSTSHDNESTTSATTKNPEQIKHLDLTFHSTVLSLRGSSLTPQPINDPASGNILCWNGEAWRIGDKRLEYGESDTDVIFELLQNAQRQSRRSIHVEDGEDEVIKALMTIHGPFAFVYHDSESGRVYFGRDCIGRRSLLYKTDGSSFMLSSVGDGSAGWEEVPADGIYVLDLCRIDDKVDAQQVNVEIMHDIELSTDPSAGGNEKSLQSTGVHIRHYSYQSFDKYATFNHTPPPAHQKRLTIHSPAVRELKTLLLDALAIRIRTIPGLHHDPTSTSSTPPPAPIAILFSGGLDCTTLARLLHTILPPTHSIDLLNVAFHNPHIHKSSTPTPAIYASCPDRITALQSHTELQRVCPERLWRLVEINVPFDEAMRERSLIADLMSPKCTEMDLSIAMALFLASRGRGVIRPHGAPSSSSSSSSPNISSANNANTTNKSDTSGEYSYTTPSRILLSGLGADELFAGYARHATAFSRAGYAGLTAELALDVQRLGSRNLGRDDRVVSHWGREVRYPFLDEEVMAWAVRKGVGGLCGFGLADETDPNSNSNENFEEDEDASTIEDGKLVLRLLAYKLGMHQVAREKKRAIQFGARTAKMHGKTSGTAAMMAVSGH